MLIVSPIKTSYNLPYKIYCENIVKVVYDHMQTYFSWI